MPLELDNYDVSILKALLKDGRKSFREISREIDITTPTVKSRFDRLVNIGFIKSVSPILDFNIVEEEVVKPGIQEAKNANSNVIEYQEERTKINQYHQQKQRKQCSRYRIKRGMKIKLD